MVLLLVICWLASAVGRRASPNGRVCGVVDCVAFLNQRIAQTLASFRETAAKVEVRSARSGLLRRRCRKFQTNSGRIIFCFVARCTKINLLACSRKTENLEDLRPMNAFNLNVFRTSGSGKRCDFDDE